MSAVVSSFLGLGVWVLVMWSGVGTGKGVYDDGLRLLDTKSRIESPGRLQFGIVMSGVLEGSYLVGVRENESVL